MAWCEANRVEYVLGLAKNERLKTEIAKEMAEAKAQYQQILHVRTRLFKEFFSSDAEKLESCATRGGQGLSIWKRERTRDS